jgi:hypothetical protein
MSNALEAAGLTVTSVPFHHHHAADLRNRLADFGPGDGIVVWADPLGEGGDRRTLDRALRHAESTGAWVSTRPDVIDKLGTKDVLVTTRSLGWGSDTHRYQDRDEFRRGFPARLGADGVRVLKATRGNGGRTVWKVRLPGGPARNALGPHAPVIVQHARIRDRAATTMTLADAMHLIEEAGALDGWGGAGYLVDQEFIPGVTRGIVRCYLVGDAVVGFARQYPDGVIPDGPVEVVLETQPSADDVMGLPSPKTMYAPDEPELGVLRHRLESSWVPEMTTLLELDRDHLPALWTWTCFSRTRLAGNRAAAPLAATDLGTSCARSTPAASSRSLLKHRPSSPGTPSRLSPAALASRTELRTRRAAAPPGPPLPRAPGTPPSHSRR